MQPYYDAFPREDIQIIITEDLKDRPSETINSCFSFLGLSPLDNVNVPKLNPTIILKSPAFYRNTMYWLSKESDNWLKNIYRQVVSDRMRIKIRKHVIRSLDFARSGIAKKEGVIALGSADRIWLKEFYKEDVLSFEELTKVRLSQWKDFLDCSGLT